MRDACPVFPFNNFQARKGSRIKAREVILTALFPGRKRYQCGDRCVDRETGEILLAKHVALDDSVLIGPFTGAIAQFRYAPVDDFLILALLLQSDQRSVKFLSQFFRIRKPLGNHQVKRVR